MYWHIWSPAPPPPPPPLFTGTVCSQAAMAMHAVWINYKFLEKLEWSFVASNIIINLQNCHAVSACTWTKKWFDGKFLWAWSKSFACCIPPSTFNFLKIECHLVLTLWSNVKNLSVNNSFNGQISANFLVCLADLAHRRCVLLFGTDKDYACIFRLVQIRIMLVFSGCM